MTQNKQRVVIVGLIIIGVIIIGVFGMRVFHAFREFRGHRPPPFPRHGEGPTETDVDLIRDWMTIGSISQTYHLPPQLLYEALNIRPNGNEKKSLKQLNNEYFPDQPGYVLKTVKTVIQEYFPTPLPTPNP